MIQELPMQDILFVTGASGQLGRAVISHLLAAQGVAPGRIVAGTREPAKLAELAAQGVRVVALDFEQPESLARAFAGVDRLLLISTDALDRPGRRLAQHLAAVEAARAAGVGHVLYTSMPNPADSLVPFAPDHLGTEAALQASGLGWSILRNAWYQENLLMEIGPVLERGQWTTAAGDGRYAPISRDDCARAAAAALAGKAEAGRIYNLSGPELLGMDEIAAIASQAFGRPVVAVKLDDATRADILIQAGLPPFIAPVLVASEANIRAGKFALLSGDVEALTGQAPRPLAATFAALRKAA
jgi:NAD(P)H dehydrogenase (quinone)